MDHIIAGANQSPSTCEFEHVDNRYGTVSILLHGLSVQFAVGCVVGHKMFFGDCPCIGRNENLVFVLLVCWRRGGLFISG